MNHRPRKRLGQHFLHDKHVIARIITAIAPQAGDHLVEIGPGPGTLTIPLLEFGIELDAIELDNDLAAALKKITAPANSSLIIHNMDALGFSLCGIVNNDRKLRVIGNLPYNISTPLLFHFMAHRHCIIDMHLMLQKEVVDRMVATPGGGDYGRLSVMIQYHCMVQRLFTIGPGAFHPAPKVDSSFVRLIPHEQPVAHVEDPGTFELVVRTAFSHRRKTLRNALKGLVHQDMFTAADVDPSLRPEQLSLDAFARLSNRLNAGGTKQPTSRDAPTHSA